jgi:uncharacterized membrane protein
VEAPRESDCSTGLSPPFAAALAYSGWWATGFLFWFVERRSRFVRFHAAQSIVVFGLLAALIAVLALAAGIALIQWPRAVPAFLWSLGFTWGAAVLLWLVMLWHAARGLTWRMPWAARVAERMLAGTEQPTA